MEIIRVLAVLRNRWRWVLPGLALAVLAAVASAYKVSAFPPKLTKETALEYGSASTQVLVDYRDSALGSLERGFEPLMARAGVYARLVTSPSLLAHVSEKSGIPAAAIQAEGPFNPFRTRQEKEPTAERRADQLASESNGYRLRMDTEQGIPVISIFSVAPTARAAEQLANGAAEGLTAYVQELKPSGRRRTADSIDIRQLAWVPRKARWSTQGLPSESASCSV